MTSRRNLPEVPSKTKPYAFWSQFVPSDQPSSEAASENFDFGYYHQRNVPPDEFPPDLDDVTALREEFELQFESKSATRRKRDKTRQRLVKTVSTRLDEDRYKE